MSKNQVKLLKNIVGSMDLPKELVFNLPRIILTSNEEIFIENYRGMVNYSETEVHLNTTKMPIKITGTGLTILQIAAEEITVCGTIKSVEFLR